MAEARGILVSRDKNSSQQNWVEMRTLLWEFSEKTSMKKKSWEVTFFVRSRKNRRRVGEGENFSCFCYFFPSVRKPCWITCVFSSPLWCFFFFYTPKLWEIQKVRKNRASAYLLFSVYWKTWAIHREHRNLRFPNSVLSLIKLTC